MDLPLPFNMGYGEKLDTADCYAELCLYPGGLDRPAASRLNFTETQPRSV